MRYASAEVRYGDDIRTLAQRLLGDQHEWRTLVRVNRLAYPYVAPSGSSHAGRVLTPGSTILYPGGSSGEPQAASLSHNVDAEAYRRDLYLDTRDGLLRASGASFSVLTGMDNLRDAVQRRTSTAIGGHPAHPRLYGHAAKQYVGGVADGDSLRLIEQEFERCIRQDSRVLTVTSTASYDGAKIVRVVSRVTPVPPGRTFTIEQQLA